MTFSSSPTSIYIPVQGDVDLAFTFVRASRRFIQKKKMQLADANLIQKKSA